MKMLRCTANCRLRPDIFLVLIRCPHSLDDLLALCLGDVPVLRDNLAKKCVDFASHVRCVTADVEVCLLLEQLVDLLAVLLQLVLNVDLLGTVS